MNELKNNIDKLRKQVNAFSSYVDTKENDSGSKQNIFSKIFENDNRREGFLSKMNININSKRSALIMLSIPIIIFFILYIVRPKILLKNTGYDQDEEILKIDITKFVIISLVLSAIVILFLQKKTSLLC
jgi:hypothetical protein